VVDRHGAEVGSTSHRRSATSGLSTGRRFRGNASALYVPERLGWGPRGLRLPTCPWRHASVPPPRVASLRPRPRPLPRDVDRWPPGWLGESPACPARCQHQVPRGDRARALCMPSRRGTTGRSAVW